MKQNNSRDAPIQVEFDGAFEVCPVCGSLLCGEYNYCSNCGQRLINNRNEVKA